MRERIFGVVFTAAIFVVSAVCVYADDESPLVEQNSELAAFLGEPVFLMQPIFPGRGGNSIVTAQDGTVLAFHGDQLRLSRDGGRMWSRPIQIASGANGNAVVNEANGQILYVRDLREYMWTSNDSGLTWSGQQIKVLPDGFAHGPKQMSNYAMQSGITLQFGKHKGRLIMPTRIFGPEGSNDVQWRPYHYNTAMYSDDGGKTWQISAPFPVLGTGEAALAELSDGSIYYNSREHMSDGNRFIAWSYDGGQTWLNAYRCAYLPDGVRGNSYGCKGGLVRLPVDGHDILIYSNLDAGAGTMPRETGGTRTRGREHITVWVSFDGAKTWPVKRLVFGGPGAYSNLAVGRAGTSSEGRLFLLFNGGPDGRNSAVQSVVFNLSWILDGRDIKAFLKNEIPSSQKQKGK